MKQQGNDYNSIVCVLFTRPPRTVPYERRQFPRSPRSHPWKKKARARRGLDRLPREHPQQTPEFLWLVAVQSPATTAVARWESFVATEAIYREATTTIQGQSRRRRRRHGRRKHQADIISVYHVPGRQVHGRNGTQKRLQAATDTR